MKVTKTQQVLDYLQNHGTITSWEAINLFGDTRLSSTIYNLRKHYDISSTNKEFVDRNGRKSIYAEYAYHGAL